MNIFLFLYVLKNIKILHLAKTWIRKIYNLDLKKLRWKINSSVGQ